ncbi:histone H4 [Trichophyton mentagrophytes]|nr:histone H4 [Trichophyton mentagrophytes]
MEVPLKLSKRKNHTAKYLPRGYRKNKRDNIMGITKPAIRRLARRGGVVRIQKAIYKTVREVVVSRLQTILEQVVMLLESTDTPAKTRKTVTTSDIVFVLKRLGTSVYGFDHL